MKAQTYVITRTVRPDAGTLPDFDLRILTRDTVRAARRYFAEPGVRERFEAWLAEKQAQGLYLEPETEVAAWPKSALIP